MSLAS